MAIMTAPVIKPMLSGNAMAIGRALTSELGALAQAYGQAKTSGQRSHIIVEVAKRLQTSQSATQEVQKLSNRDVKNALSMANGRFAMRLGDGMDWSPELLEEAAVKEAAPVIEKTVERTFMTELLEMMGAAALAFSALPGAMQLGIIIIVVIVVICVANGFFHWW